MVALRDYLNFSLIISSLYPASHLTFRNLHFISLSISSLYLHRVICKGIQLQLMAINSNFPSKT